MQMNQYHPYAMQYSHTVYIKRTEVPFYSDRLNKRIQVHSYLSRLVDYLLSKDDKKIDFALNSLLTKSYQEKLIFSISIEKDFKETMFPIPSILDSLLNAIVSFTPENKNNNSNNNDDDDDKDSEELTTYKLNLNNDTILISKIVSILRNSILQKPNDQYLANNPTALLALLEIAHSYLTYRKSLSSKQNSFDPNTFNPFDSLNLHPINQLNSNITRYIIEIFSKIIQYLTLQQPPPPPQPPQPQQQQPQQNDNETLMDITTPPPPTTTATTTTTTATNDNKNNNENEDLVKSLNEKNIFSKDQVREMCYGSNKFYVLKKLPVSILTKKLLSILEMSIYCFKDDSELLACVETIDYICKSKRNRYALDELVMKPIYDQFIISNNSPPPPTSSSTSNAVSSPLPQTSSSSSSSNVTSPPFPTTTTTTTTTTNNNETLQSTSTPPTFQTLTSSVIETFTIKNPKKVFEKHPNLISRVVELLSHSHQSIQLLSIQILSTLSKSSQKLRITICHYPGLVRHLINLLTHKPTGENAEISKRAASLLSRLSKESYNLPILLPFETTLAQIALTDNPHSDIITNILVRFEIKNNYN
ncbi:hypothetical protein DDB_G0278395 [Dictyostelium discoideum AX4]|uniref:Uncharacterized protein n=1 Tax=Dictyostelium discoideum TaxID=44689 RepID=Q54Y63_DICDI|nr:hypothetical protein DDB_G0278395 [Dictyostelium discoideum AX4]EAL68370.1 hypothetical protein DDB_G0278395 [Dictyostelium discoideum AX4]|eukprot:XP_642339.1 hypothetical protein DDB_G0278395 [Dictyostelium discoideum AX4]